MGGIFMNIHCHCGDAIGHSNLKHVLWHFNELGWQTQDTNTKPSIHVI